MIKKMYSQTSSKQLPKKQRLSGCLQGVVILWFNFIFGLNFIFFCL